MDRGLASSPAEVDHGIDAFCAFTTGIAVTLTADPELRDPMLMLATWWSLKKEKKTNILA